MNFVGNFCIKTIALSELFYSHSVICLLICYMTHKLFLHCFILHTVFKYIKMSVCLRKVLINLQNSRRIGICLASLVAQLVNIHLQCRSPQFSSWVGKIPWRRDRLPVPVFLGFPDGSDGKDSACNAGDLDSIPGLEDPLEEGMATHSSILAWKTSMDRGA